MKFLFVSLILYVGFVLANLARFDENSFSQVCSGMYSKQDWGGSFKPHIGLTLNQYNDFKYDPKNKDQEVDKDISVSYIIFEYKDLVNIGADLGNGQYKFICDDTAINDFKVCDEKQKGKFIVNKNVTNSTILTAQLTHLGQANINYPVNVTGYYCISTFSQYKETVYRGEVNFQNAFGQLSASEIPKLPAYGILAICYAIALALFGFQFFKKRKENQILPLQRYLLAMLGFLTFDTVVVWSYYDLVNRIESPSSGFARFYMIFLTLLNAAKITFSFFLLLCISLGYGVVKLKLDKKVMFGCKILAAFNFVASFVYLFFNYYGGSSNALVSTDSIDTAASGSFLGLLPIIPIAIILSIYYVTILASIRKTTESLHKQRQIIKLNLYQNLFKIIFGSVILTFLGLTLSSFVYLSMSSTEMFEQHWKGSFFIYDFWPSVVFFIVFMAIAWLWRPTETSYMLAISSQVANDDENGEYQQGMELDTFSLMSHSDDEEHNPQRQVERDSFELPSKNIQPENPPQYDQLSTHEPHEAPSNTLFELGEDDEISDHEGDNRLKDHKHKE
ncbi:protein Ptm1 precursor, putative [Candida dubliniensis CD36]|uniref:Transmembrane protein, putative n=1 Tax=Candida dubliniensis (strain CD36 / ATCC MYA-646 / CBS 7987 / NCPF 3949 / NRRL Y-17841) TaxID=573826 RepID=B9WAI0_CANDC|nr:protein Ptm1 precursor, putative [Candida dubliniensis CD36]CAX43400.1 protein Ptm1 precursor, putative [Candida dubliniensis CD36]